MKKIVSIKSLPTLVFSLTTDQTSHLQTSSTQPSSTINSTTMHRDTPSKPKTFIQAKRSSMRSSVSTLQLKSKSTLDAQAAANQMMADTFGIRSSDQELLELIAKAAGNHKTMRRNTYAMGTYVKPLRHVRRNSEILSNTSGRYSTSEINVIMSKTFSKESGYTYSREDIKHLQSTLERRKSWDFILVPTGKNFDSKSNNWILVSDFESSEFGELKLSYWSRIITADGSATHRLRQQTHAFTRWSAEEPVLTSVSPHNNRALLDILPNTPEHTKLTFDDFFIIKKPTPSAP